MNTLNKLYFTVSIMIAGIATILIPSNPEQGNIILRYKYGFPLKYMTIIQDETTSKWFGDNFFTGNIGLAIDPFILLINIFILYYVVLYSVKIFSKYFAANKNHPEHINSHVSSWFDLALKWIKATLD